jgi:NAD+ kinase
VNIGILLHPDRPLARELARESALWLQGQGHQVKLPAFDAQIAGLQSCASSHEEFAAGLDVIVSLGGDGTMLRAVELAGPEGAPILGVNIGQLGYLTRIEPASLRPSLERVLRGDFGVEHRMTLAVRYHGREYRALNEAVIEKSRLGHTVRLAVSFDGEFFTTYAADGLIVATPTGSTAYSLSARGPVVSPTHRALLLTPVSPHMLFDRSILLESSSVVRIENVGERPASLSIDGRNIVDELAQGAVVEISEGSHPVRLVTFEDRNFHSILKAKFGLADR